MPDDVFWASFCSLSDVFQGRSQPILTGGLVLTEKKPAISWKKREISLKTEPKLDKNFKEAVNSTLDLSFM